MKIALIIEHFDPARGGAEHFTVWLAERLVAAGHEVHVLCHDSGRRPPPRSLARHGASHDARRWSGAAGSSGPVRIDGVHIHILKTIKLSTGVGFRRFGRAAQRWCRARRPDVAHSMSVAWPGDLYHPHAGVYARLQSQAVASRRTPAAARLKRFLLRLSGKQRALLALDKRAMRPPERGGPWKILCLSARMQRDFRALYGVAPAQLEIMENPFTCRPPPPAQWAAMRRWFREMYRLNETDRVAVFAGHDFRRKGLDWAIRTIAAAAPWKLLVVGMGRTRAYLELAQRLGVAERVLFIGPTRQMDHVYSAGDALLLPTFYDSFGLVALEALAQGLPVISTRFLGAGEMIERHALGTIVDSPCAVREMAAALAAPPWSGCDRMEFARRAMRALGDLSPAAYLAKLEDLYRRCLADKAAGD